MRTTRPRLLLLATIALFLTGLLAPATAGAAAPYCGIRWGSLPKVHDGFDTAHEFIHGIRAGRHACFDRLVLDLGDAGGFDSYDVRYVPQVVEDGRGDVVPLRGGADLQVVVRATPYDASGTVTYTPRDRREVVDVTGFSTFRQVAWAGAFEGQTTLGVGTRALLPFRVFLLPGPGAGSGQDMRMVIDVAHRW